MKLLSNYCRLAAFSLPIISLLVACNNDNTTSGKAWGTAELIENGNAVSPQIAVDPDGNAIAVWEQYDGTNDHIWARRYVAGVGWGTAELIETGYATSPQIAVDPSGNAVAVWKQFDDTNGILTVNIWANRYVAGTGWGAAELIETDNAGAAGQPQIAVDPDGNAMAVWSQYDSNISNIWANRYVAGVGWGTAELIETENAGETVSPQIAVDATGSAVAVWQQFDGTSYNIMANRYVTGTGWGAAEPIEADVGYAASPQIAVDPSGNTMAVWTQYDGTNYNILANHYVAGAGWGTVELIETDAGYADAPQIAVDPNGNAIAVWEQFNGANYNIWANRYVAGVGWGIAGPVENDTAGEAASPQIAVDSSGNAMAVWEQSDGAIYNIWAIRYVAGMGWGVAELIETNNAGTAGFTQIAVDPSGNAIAVWAQYDGTSNNIFANSFK